jgi:hypothetical protein
MFNTTWCQRFSFRNAAVIDIGNKDLLQWDDGAFSAQVAILEQIASNFVIFNDNVV